MVLSRKQTTNGDAFVKVRMRACTAGRSVTEHSLTLAYKMRLATRPGARSQCSPRWAAKNQDPHRNPHTCMQQLCNAPKLESTKKPSGR